MAVGRSMRDLREIEDLLDLCMARAEGVLAQARWEDLARVKGRIRARRGFVGEILAVALAGATGSGKSSILNALCGEEVAAVGLVRPTTSRSLAAVPQEMASDLAPFIELLGVDDTVAVTGLIDLVVVDLPDMDSTVSRHRLAVEEALGVVDAVVWVLDPEKYADRVIHEEFLAPLSPYSDQFIFCLNQVDRLGTDVAGVLHSLERHLESDGYTTPQIVATVATSEDPGAGIGLLREALDGRLDLKRTAQMKISTDVRRMASDCWQSLHGQFDDLSGPDRVDAAVAMASLVSLGIAAFELHHELSEATGD